MIVKSLDQLYLKIREDILNKDSSLYIADKDNTDSELEELLVQMLERTNNLEKISFLAIRNIVVKESFRSQGKFKLFISKLEDLKPNLIFHDVINPNLYKFLKNKNYLELKEEKYVEKIVSLYKIF